MRSLPSLALGIERIVAELVSTWSSQLEAKYVHQVSGVSVTLTLDWEMSPHLRPQLTPQRSENYGEKGIHSHTRGDARDPSVAALSFTSHVTQ